MRQRAPSPQKTLKSEGLALTQVEKLSFLCPSEQSNDRVCVKERHAHKNIQTNQGLALMHSKGRPCERPSDQINERLWVKERQAHNKF